MNMGQILKEALIFLSSWIVAKLCDKPLQYYCRRDRAQMRRNNWDDNLVAGRVYHYLQFIRELSPFQYFLEVVAQCNGKIINFSKIARDVGVDHKTVENYYSILEDTLLGFFLPAYDDSFRKQISKAPKFYLFDTGVSRALARMLSVTVREKTAYYGELFEQFIICEIKKYINYYHDEYRLTHLCTKNDKEIDLIVQRPAQETLLIEIKSGNDIQLEQLKALASLKDEIPNSVAICISNDKNKKRYGDIVVWPWREAIMHYFKSE